MGGTAIGSSSDRSTLENFEEKQMRLLIVEDCKAEQARLEAMLHNLGYSVLTAETGLQGMEILARESIDLVLSDWRMPKMSGIELCRAVQKEPGLGNPYLILVTGCNNKCDLVAGMDAGADDFVTKPFNAEELRVRVQAGKRIIQLREKAEKKHQALKVSLAREASAVRRIQRDLRRAASMQRNLLPDISTPINGLSIAQIYQPLETVAGDSFNYYLLDNHLVFFHSDVVGHGITAAMVSFALTRYLSSHSEMLRQKADKDRFAAPEEVVAALNKRFHDQGDEEQYFTMVYGALDTVSGHGRLCQAGHPHPLVIDTDGHARELGKGGFPVGMFADVTYEGTDFSLSSGERLFLFSDGVSECRNNEGVPFKSQRMAKLLEELNEYALEEQVHALDHRLQDWRNGRAQEDDISLLAIERTRMSANNALS